MLGPEQLWHYRILNQEFGPVEFPQIMDLARAGHLSAGDELRCGEDGVWFPAGAVERLFPEHPSAEMPEEIHDLSQLSFRFAENSEFCTGLTLAGSPPEASRFEHISDARQSAASAVSEPAGDHNQPAVAARRKGARLFREVYMADHQRTVDEIRFHLQSQDLELTDEVRQLADALSGACREVNSRLRRCSEFLRQGLRSEAIHLAEAEPKLLDLVAQLDFPEREQWDEILSIYQLPKCEPLLLDVAEALNEAYAAEQPLQKLLARHRLLAMAQAQLAQRIAVMRRLAELDPEATFWDDDIRDFEKARFREIQSEAAAAADRGDVSTLEALVEELQRQGWREGPPKALVRTIKAQGAQVSRSAARGELERLELELNEAFGALDLPRARRFRDRWKTLAEKAQLRPEDPLQDRVGPALGWLADEDAKQATERAFQKAVAALERALDNGAEDVRELERLGQEILKLDRAIPEPLAGRYRHRISGLEFASTRRRRLVIGSVAAAVLLVGGLIGVMIQRSIRTQEMERVIASIDQLLGSSQLGEARRLFDSHQEFSTLGGWLDLQQRLASAEQQEQDRAAQLSLALTSAEQTMSYPEAAAALEQARELARTSEEKLEVGRLEQQWQRKRQDEVAAAEAEFREQVQGISENLRRAEELLGDAAGQDATRRLFNELDAQVAVLQSADGVRPELQSQTALLVSRLTSLREMRLQSLEKSRLLNQLTENSLIPPAALDGERKLRMYGAALEEYSTAFPEDARSADFKSAAAEADLWRGVVEWQALTSRWGSLRPRNFDYARRRIAECEEFLTKYGRSPAAPAAREYLVYLQAIRSRRQDETGDESSSIKADLRELLTGPLMDQTHTLQTRNGETYYLLGPVEYSSQPLVTFRYISGFGSETTTHTLRSDVLITRKSVPAGQSKLALDIKRQIEILPLDEWEPSFRGIGERILKALDVDPFLRYFLLLQTLKAAGRGSVPLQMELEPLLKKLEASEIDLATRWMDPQDARANVSRERAKEVLASVPDLEGIWNAAAQREREMRDRLFRQSSAIGWICRAKDGGWTCRTTWTANGDFILRLAVPDDSNSASSWIQLGAATPKGIELRVPDESLLKEGRLVFAVESAPQAVAGR